MINVRRLEKAYIREYIEDFMLNVENFGYGFIEVKLSDPGETTEIVIGIDEAKVQLTRKPGSRVTIAAGVKVIKDGVATFYPDKSFNRWAYVLDTERNRMWLASSIRHGKYMVTDNRIKSDIEDIAIKNDWPITPVDGYDNAFSGYVRGNNTVEVEKLKEELDALKNKVKGETKPLTPLKKKRRAEKTNATVEEKKFEQQDLLEDNKE